jgi:predicted methyltransferase
MGAGAGYSTELVARVIGPTGTVYGQNPPDNFERPRNAFAMRAATPAMKNSVTLLRPYERLIPLTQVRLYVVGASMSPDSRFCVDCLA